VERGIALRLIHVFDAAASGEPGWNDKEIFARSRIATHT
jgi:hypothetical protein